MDRWGLLKHKLPLSKPGAYHARSIDRNPKGTWIHTSAINSKTATPDSITTILSLFADSSFTEITDQGTYKTGQWSYRNNVLVFSQQNSTQQFNASYQTASNGLRLLNLKPAKGDSLSFAGFGKSIAAFTMDPFYAANNQWRIKSDTAETKQQILSRLRNYLLHQAHLLNTAYLRRQQVISWQFSACILKVYRGGIGLVPREKIPEAWINCFHSRQEAYLAYDILDDYLRTTTYRERSKGNWLLDDCQILMTIYRRLENRNLAAFKPI